MKTTYTDLNPTPRVLMGPGPSMVHPRVLRSMNTPVVGHLDPNFLEILSDVKALLRFIFQTENELTLAVPGTGTSGMDAALSNTIEPGDAMLACISGYFGERLADMGRRYGAQVDVVECPWGEILSPDDIAAALKKTSYKVVTLVHAETSTGTLQSDITTIAEACHQNGALLILDCVTSLGGLPVEIDAWDVDIAYSAAQKALSAPPGLSPITVSARAEEIIAARRTPPPVFYLDLQLLKRYWSDTPSYHHTTPINLIYALREALRLAYEEGLEALFERHRINAKTFWEGLEGLDLTLFVPPALRLTTLTTPQIPDGVDGGQLKSQLLEKYNIEIAGGFGPLAGKIWRIGLMGHSSRRENVRLLLAALEDLLAAQ
jgi:alanine-glyoxylate transaminase/serine-glyoxylate transaminase/serine-pyruvate transaminase